MIPTLVALPGPVLSPVEKAPYRQITPAIHPVHYTSYYPWHGVRSEIPERMGSETFRTNRLQTVSCMFEKCVQIPPNRRRATRYPFIDPRHAPLV